MFEKLQYIHIGISLKSNLFHDSGDISRLVSDFSFSINFNQDASLICVSSDHATVHIFAAEDPKRNKQSR